RLCIGLAGEGALVTRIVPDVIGSENVQLGEMRMALLSRMTAPMHVLPWMRPRRTERLVMELQDSPPDVFYAVGVKAWPIAIDLGAAMQRPVAIDLWSMDQVRHAAHLRHSTNLAGYIVPTESIAD